MTGIAYSTNSFYKRWADNNMLIEPRERAAGKGPAYKCSGHKVAPVKVLEDEWKDIKW